MDIDSIVKNLMMAERMPLDRMKQDKQILEWQRDDYRAMNALMLDFRNKLSDMRFTTNYRARTVSTSDDTRVTATASSAAAQGSYSITKVDKLASAETWVTTTSINSDNSTPVDGSKSIKSQENLFANSLTWQTGAVGSQTITANGTDPVKLNLHTNETIVNSELSKMSVQVNGKSYKVVAAGNLEGAANQVTISANGELSFSSDVQISSGASVKVDYVTNQKVQEGTLKEGAATYSLSKKNLAEDGFTVSLDGGAGVSISNVTGNIGTLDGIGEINLDTGVITFNDGVVSADMSIRVNYKQEYTSFSAGAYNSTSGASPVTENFLIESSQSLNQVFSRVNSSKAGISMLLDETTGQLSVMKKETGDYNTSGNDIQLEGDLAGLLNLDSSTVTQGSDAEFTINGLATTRKSNTFTMSGVTFTLKQTFDETETPAGLTVNNDGNQVFDNIKEFVENYNTLIGGISLKTSEERYRSFQPLTDEQRGEMSEKQQEQWDEKAKSGLIRRDPILTGALSSMRNDFYSPVTNSDTDPMMRQLASIGITTTSNYIEGGKLEINEAKLKAAINNNPEAIEAMFIGGNNNTNDSEKGIIHRLHDTATETMDRLRTKAGNEFSTLQNYSLGKSIVNVDERIQRFEDRLIQVEDRYWAQFTAMEKAVSQANSQGMYLMSQLGMGGQ
ncbi:flagellar filament capping protein FliD [Jeotgalibacillus sp. HH7-29]|uniref:Flagellar hook-associated protein 2 n=2 Tax=Jeotgalibacillus haloalkalitolerans TaxID=3104292 RepID=A0ABU5KJP7_9BACL|nr:flagellar filament capping protein FliD [Jeotgalibacillus sp. HH7-29]